MKKEWYYYYVKSRRGSDINFMSVVRVNINSLSPNVFPVVEDNGKRYWTPLITQEGNKLLDQLICEAELARKQYDEEQRRFDDDGPTWQEEADELNRAFWRECGDAGSNCESWPGWD